MDLPLVRFLHFDKAIFSQHTLCIPRVGEKLSISNGENKNYWIVREIEYVYAFRPAIGYLPPSVVVRVVPHEEESISGEDITLPPERYRR
jgi:hypothetical protein